MILSQTLKNSSWVLNTICFRQIKDALLQDIVMREEKMFKKIVVLFVFLFGGLNASDRLVEKLENDILMAENYLWLTMDEGSFTKVDKKTLKYIDISNKLLKQMTISDKELYEYKIKSLKDQLFALRAVEGKSLNGFFPLLKYTVSDFFFMPSNPKIHTLVKNPKYLGVYNAVRASTNILRQLHQRHVFINSIPNDSEAEEIAFSFYNKTDKLFSRLDKEVVTALGNKKNIQNFRENNITQEVSNKLCDYVGDDSIYLVTIVRNLTEDREYYYTVSTVNYGYKGKDNLMSTDAFGYAIDESPGWPIIIFIHLCLLFLIIGITLFKSKKRTWDNVVLPVLFFIIGRVTPWIIIPAMLTFKPGSSAPALYSFWWVLLLGIVLFIVPIILVKLFYKKALEYASLPEISGKGNIIGLSAAAGAVAFLIIPYIYAFGDIATIAEVVGFVIFGIAVLFSGYIMGKILDDNDKMDEKNLVYFVITSSLLIASFMHGESIYLIVASLISIVVSMIVIMLHMKKVRKERLEENKLIVDDSLAKGGECDDIESINLNDRVNNPPYQRFDYYKNIIQSTKSILNGKSTYLVLKGDAGSGKTATAKIFIDTIGMEITNQNETVLLLSSVCEKHDGNEIAYGMFYSLLDSTLSVDLFGQRKKDEQFDKVISMASSFLMGPVASFLSPESGNDTNAFSKSDIYILVKQKLIELSTHSTLIILIDDLQWIDTASKELLKYLMEVFGNESNHKIVFVFTVRSTEEGNEVIHDLNLGAFVHSIGFIEKDEQRILLERSFCLSPSSSKWIVEWASEQNSNRIYPYILVDAVGNLSRTNVLEIKENGFSIKDDFDFENPPIPDGPRKEVRDFVSNYPEYTEILSLASIYGKEFHVRYLSEALGITYLECIRQLDAISVEGGLLFDVYDKDDIYQFRSQMILDATRAFIRYSNKGMKAAHVPQAIRHFHALAASSMEHSLEEKISSRLTMEIANHYYAAGKLYANKAIEYGLKSADICRKMFQYDDALNYLDKVDEVSSLINQFTIKSKQLRLLVECDKSNVTGEGALDAANKILEYIGIHEKVNDNLKIAAARACYDAGAQHGAQEWFTKTVDFSKAYLLPSDSLLLQAEGHHFIGISLNPRDTDLIQTRLDHLYKALELAKEEDSAVYAKIANSLAEALSYGSSEDKEKAKELFVTSLHIKENAEIKDLPGIARTYGGLGRLTFFSDSPDIEEAKKYFIKDLEIAKEIDDKRGISQMNSFLGSCALKQSKNEEAIGFYNKSIQMMNNPFDIHASFEGKLNALVNLNVEEDIEKALKEYEDILEKIGMPPAFLVKSIITNLERYPDCKICKKVLKKLNDES